ncbi:AAA family ATPase, partial [Bacteroides sp.]|uniref:AAA family ATPase n=1 Tax=Bacteroides sp. TaxID=29523 RepID=UPI003AB65155
MKDIRLKHLELVNFKGIRSFELSFDEMGVAVCGGNGTGKTTIFDAFLWLLFGKDSTGRSDSNFNIKTLDSDGKPILHLEHSVTGVLSVDGKTVTL